MGKDKQWRPGWRRIRIKESSLNFKSIETFVMKRANHMEFEDFTDGTTEGLDLRLERKEVDLGED